MVVGCLRLTLHIPQSRSLKDKRMVVRSLVARLRHTFNVAAAEVDDQDIWQTAVIGVVCVSGDSRHADEMTQKVLAYIEDGDGDALVTRHAFELVHV